MVKCAHLLLLGYLLVRITKVDCNVFNEGAESACAGPGTLVTNTKFAVQVTRLPISSCNRFVPAQAGSMICSNY